MRNWFPGMGAFAYFRKLAKTNPHLSPGWGGGGAWVNITELYNNWRTCSYTSFSQQSEAKNMADFE